MFAIPAHFAELQRGQIDTLQALTSALVDATQKLTNLNLATARAFMQESNQTIETLFASQDPQATIALVGASVQPAAETLASYATGVYGIACGASAELSKVIEASVAERSDKLSEFIDATFQNQPAGSEAAVSFLKGAFSASAPMFSVVSKAANQLSELVQAKPLADAAAAEDLVKAKRRKAA
jgi:phasin family protein